MYSKRYDDLVKNTEHSTSSEATSVVYFSGDRAFLLSREGDNRAIRYKYEVWKELDAIYDVFRAKHTYETTPELDDHYDFDLGQWVTEYGDPITVTDRYIGFELKRGVDVGSMSSRRWYMSESELQEDLEYQAFMKEYEQLEKEQTAYHRLPDRRSIDHIWEMATSPLFPHYNAAYIALLNSGFADHTLLDVGDSWDDKDSNFLWLDGKIVPIDIHYLG